MLGCLGRLSVCEVKICKRWRACFERFFRACSGRISSILRALLCICCFEMLLLLIVYGLINEDLSLEI